MGSHAPRTVIVMAVLLCGLFALNPLAWAAGRGDWWTLQHDPQHTGHSPFPGPQVPVLNWSSDLQGSLTSPVVQGADGTLYDGAYDSWLRAIAPDGTQLWYFSPSIISVEGASAAIGTDGTIYSSGGTGGYLYAINPDGTEQWAFNGGGQLTAPTLGTDGTIYLAQNTTVFALSPSGAQYWTFPVTGAIYSAPALGYDGTIYVCTYDGQVYAINADGSQKWVYATGDQIESAPVVGADGTVYCTTLGGSLYALTAAGKKKWQFAAGDILHASPALRSDGAIYCCTRYGKLYAVSAAGSPLWVYDMQAQVFSNMAVDANDTAYLGTQIHYLFAITADGNVKWTFDAGRQITASPVIGPGGTIYFGTDDGKLSAIVNAPAPALSLSKTVSPASALPGTTLTYTLAYSNTGLVTANNVTITDTLPAHVTYVAGSGGTYNATTRTLTWSPGTLSAGQGGNVSCQVAVDANAVPGSTIVNTGTINCDGLSAPQASNNAVFTVAFPNDAPTIDPIADATLLSTAVSQTVNLTGISAGDADDAGQTITITATSNNTALIANPTVGYTSPQATGTLTFAPATGQTGSAVITVTVKDNGGTAAGGIDTTVRTFTVTVAQAQSGGWSTFHHDPQRTGRSPVAGPSIPLQRWAFAAGGPIASSPVFGVDGTIYVGSEDNKLYAINPNGSPKWSFSTSSFVEFAPAVGVDGTIYVGSLDQKLYAINPDGSQRWAFKTQSVIDSSPIIGTDGTIYIGSSDEKLYALNPDGALKWAFMTNDAVGTPAMGTDGTIYVASGDGYLYALTPAGTKKWAFSTNNYIYGSPAIGADGTIYVGADNGTLYAVNPDGTQQWAFATGQSIRSTPTIDSDGTIYCTGWESTYIYAINPNGSQKWVCHIPGRLNYVSPALGADGTLYVGGEDGNIYAIAPSGVVQWAYHTDYWIRSSPAIGADGTLYIGSDDYKLYAITQAPVIKLTKTVSSTCAALGTAVTYTLAYANTNGGAATNVSLTDTLPAQISYVAGSADQGGVYNPTTRTLTWCPGTVAPAQQGAVTFQASVDADAIVGSTIVNSGNLTYNGLEAPLVSNLASFTVSAPPTNTPPTLDPIADITASHPTTVNLTGISAGSADDAWQAITITASSNNSAVLQNPAVTYTSPQATGTLALAPVAGQAGTALVTVTVQDNGGTAGGGVDTTTRTFTVTVVVANDAPLIDPIGNMACYTNDGMQTVNLTGISAGTIGQALTITASSSNTALIPTPAVTYTSPQATATLTFTPVANQSGLAIITVTVQDDGGTANGGVDTTSRTFVVTVNRPNSAPTIDPIPDMTINRATTVNLTGISAGVGDAGQAITVTAISHDTTVLPDPTVDYTSPQATGTLTLTPIPGKYGSTVVTVLVRDDGGIAGGGMDTMACSFKVNVVFINTPPVINAIPDLLIKKNAGKQTVNLLGIGPCDAGQAITLINATSSNPALIPNPVVNYTNPLSSGTLTFTPVANKTGTAQITVTVKDSGGTANGGVDTAVRTFNVIVIEVNHAPTITQVANIAVNENSGPKIVSLSGISAGDIGQSITITATSSSPGLIANPTVNYISPKSTGTLTFTPAPNRYGTVDISVTVRDNGGTLLFGQDTTSMTFKVTVNMVNHPPVFDAIPNQQIENTGTANTVYLYGIGPGGVGEEAAQTVNVSAVSSNTALLPNPVVSGTGGIRVLILQPIAGKSGTVTITVTAKDNGGTAYGGKDTFKRAFTVTILHHQPDMLVKNCTDSTFAGKGIFNMDGTTQTKSQAIAVTGVATFNFAVRNAGTSADTFTVQNRGNASGWAVQFYFADAQGNSIAPIAGNLTGNGWSTGSLTVNQMVYLKAVVTCTDPAAAPGTLLIVATSTVNPLNGDAVKAVVTRK